MNRLDQFITEQNIRHYRNLLRFEGDEDRRRILLQLLAEEKQKQTQQRTGATDAATLPRWNEIEAEPPPNFMIPARRPRK